MKPPLPESLLFVAGGVVFVVGAVVVVVGAVVVVVGAVVVVVGAVVVVVGAVVVVEPDVEVDVSFLGLGTFSAGRLPPAGADALTDAPATSIVSAAAGCLPAFAGSASLPEEPLIRNAAANPATAIPRMMRS